MFNLVNELKKEFGLKFTSEYQLVNISGKALYAEGQRGILNLSKENVSFKVKGGVVVVEGNGLSLRVLSETTIYIEGKIKKVEVV